MDITEDIDGFASAANSQVSQASTYLKTYFKLAIRRLRRLLARPPAVSSLRSQKYLRYILGFPGSKESSSALQLSCGVPSRLRVRGREGARFSVVAGSCS